MVQSWSSCFAYVMYTRLVYYVCVGYSAATQKRPMHKTKSRFKVLNMQKGVTFITLFRGEVEGMYPHFSSYTNNYFCC